MCAYQIKKIREVCSDQFTYRGEVNNEGIFDGLGEIHFKDWKYEGEFKDGNISGYGVLECYYNGIQLDGYFSNCFLQGYCLIIHNEKEIRCNFQNGKLLDDSKKIEIFTDKDYQDADLLLSIKF